MPCESSPAELPVAKLAVLLSAVAFRFSEQLLHLLELHPLLELDGVALGLGLTRIGADAAKAARNTTAGRAVI